MKSFLFAACVFLAGAAARASVNVTVDHNPPERSTPAFHFAHVPAPSKTDAASTAKFSVIDGQQDGTGGELDVLRDGLLPGEPDAPDANFFFAAGSRGGRILIDLGNVTDVKQVNTYSWHTDSRAPQVYTLYAAADAAAPAKGADPTTVGWTKLANVDTRPKSGATGGQYAVGISNAAGSLGKFRYLLIDASCTESNDVFGNTFFSEIDVIDGNEMLRSATTTGNQNKTGVSLLQFENGKYTVTIDTSETPGLTQWANEQLSPMVIEWYPKLVKLLPSPGYSAPTHFSITFRKNKPGVADTAGNRINCAEKFFHDTLNTQAKGAILHEMVHVVQNYWIADHNNHHAKRAPTWLTEGIADYVRWYIYEPKSHGTDISKRGLATAKYDGSYRITANFLDYVTHTYDRDLVPQLNAVIRQGEYSEEIWTKLAGKPVQALGDEWKTELAKTVK